MALTQAEKKLLGIVSSEPKKALELIQSGKISLFNFKDNFLRNGEGLMTTVMHGYIYDKENYKELLFYIIENTDLSIFDKAGKAAGSDSAYDIFSLLKRKELERYISELPYLLSLEKEKVPSTEYLSSLIYFYKNNYFEAYQIILDITEQNPPHYLDTLLTSIIEKDDIEHLKKLMIRFPNYNLEYQGVREIDSIYYNYLTYAIGIKSNVIAQYMLDNFNFSLEGKVYVEGKYENPYHREHRPSIPVSPLITAAQQHSTNIFNNILNKIENKELLNIIGFENTYVKKKSFNIDSYYSNLIFKKIHFDEVNHKTLFNILNSLWSFEDKLLALKKFPFEKLDSNLHNNTTNVYWNAVYWNNNVERTITDQDTVIISETYKLLEDNRANYYSPSSLFNKQLLNNPKLLQSLIDHGMNINISPKETPGSDNPFNIWEHYLEHNFILDGKDSNIQSSWKILYDNTKSLINTQHIIQCVELSQFGLFDVMEDQVLRKATPDLLFSLKHSNSDFIKHAYKRLLEIGFDPFYQDTNILDQKLYPFFYLVQIMDKPEELDLVLKKYNPQNISIQELGNNNRFWYHLKDNDLSFFTYLKEQGLNFNNEKTIKYVLDSDNYNLIYNYFKTLNTFPNTELFFACHKNKNINASRALADSFPDLISQVNKSHRYAISYLIKNLDDFLKNQSKISQEKIENYSSYQFILHCFSKGNWTTSSKAYIQLTETLQKYPLIEEKMPELYKALFRQKLENKLEQKNSFKKTNKI